MVWARRGLVGLLVSVATAGCGRINYDLVPPPPAPDAPAEDAAPPDATADEVPDQSAASCDGTTWRAPVVVAVAGLEPHLFGPRLTADGGGLYLSQTRGTPFRDEDIWLLDRTGAGAFANPIRVEPVSSMTFDGSPFPSPDGLELFFSSARSGSRDLWVARRGQPSGNFGDPTPILFVNSDSDDQNPSLTADGLALFFATDRDAPRFREDIYTSTRASRLAAFARPERVAELSGPTKDGAPFISPDGLTIHFTSDRPGARRLDIWTATRPSRTAPFSAPVHLPELASAADDEDPSISPDGKELYFASNRAGGTFQLYRAARCR